MSNWSISPAAPFPPPTAGEFPQYIQFQEDGTDLGRPDATTVNFGSGLAATRGTGENEGVVTVTASGGGGDIPGGSGIEVSDNGVLVSENVSRLDFGANLTASPQSAGVVRLSAAGGGGGGAGFTPLVVRTFMVYTRGGSTDTTVNLQFDPPEVYLASDDVAWDTDHFVFNSDGVYRISLNSRFSNSDGAQTNLFMTFALLGDVDFTAKQVLFYGDTDPGDTEGIGQTTAWVNPEMTGGAQATMTGFVRVSNANGEDPVPSFVVILQIEIQRLS
jgi:hypothetical protein